MLKEVDGKVEGNITSIIPKVSGNVDMQVPEISGTIVGTSDVPVYDGVTEVIPNQLDLILETAQKIVTSDITVKGVPYAEVDNPSGGKTITIGG